MLTLHSIAIIREQIRALVDPLLIRLRQDLYGSGVTFGRTFQQTILPPATIVTGGNGGTDISTLGYIKGVKTYSGGTLIGSDQKELSFVNASVTMAGERTTIAILDTDRLTTAGDLLYRNGSNITTRLPIGTLGQVLLVSGGLPYWLSVVKAAIPRQVAWYEDGEVTVAASKGPLRRLDVDVTLSNAYIYVKTAPSGASLIVDILKATSPTGIFTSVFSAAPSIASLAAVGSSTSFAVSQLSAGDYLRMDVTQIGSTIPGSSLTVDLNMVTR